MTEKDLKDFDFDSLIGDNPINEEKEPTETKKDSKVDKEDKDESFFEETEDKKEEPPVKKDDDESEEESKDKSDSKEIEGFNPYAAALLESGVLPNIDLKELGKLDAAGQVQYLLDKQEDIIQERLAEGFNEWVDKMPRPLKRAIEEYVEGASLETIIKGVDNLERYQNIDPNSLEKNEMLCKQLIVEERMAQGYTREDAEEEADNIADKAKSAKKSLNKLVTLEEGKIKVDKKATEDRIKQEEYETKKTLEDVKTKINKSKEIIPGIPLNDTIRKATYDNLTKPVGKTKDGRVLNAINMEREKNPIEFELKIANLFSITKGFNDFSVFTKMTKTNAIKELENALERADYNKGRGNSFTFNKMDAESVKEQREFIQDIASNFK